MVGIIDIFGCDCSICRVIALWNFFLTAPTFVRKI